MLGLAQPAGPARPAAPLQYTSAFADYKPFRELQAGDWRALNDAVGAAAARPGAPGAQPGQTPPAAAAAPAPKASMPAHDMKSMPGMRHPMHGGRP